MSWEKIGITLAIKPSSTSGGLYARIPKKTADAYNLWTVDVLEVTLERALRQPKTMTNGGPHINCGPEVSAGKTSRKKAGSEALSRGESVSRPDIRTRRHRAKGSEGI